MLGVNREEVICVGSEELVSSAKHGLKVQVKGKGGIKRENEKGGGERDMKHRLERKVQKIGRE